MKSPSWQAPVLQPPDWQPPAWKPPVWQPPAGRPPAGPNPSGQPHVCPPTKPTLAERPHVMSCDICYQRGLPRHVLFCFVFNSLGLISLSQANIQDVYIGIVRLR